MRRRGLILPSEATAKDWLLTAEDFQKGIFHDASRGGRHIVRENYYDGADGFQLKGTGGYYADMQNWVNCTYWKILVDLTNYTTVEAKVQKLYGHGTGRMGIFPPNAPTSEVSGHGAQISHEQMQTGVWYDMSINVSDLSGEYYVLFLGGYWDWSGAQDSENAYANIIFRAHEV